MSGHKYSEGLDRNAANFVPLSPLSFLRKAALLHPARTAIIQGERRQSWAETFTRCRRLASALTRLGVAHGDTVAIMAPNTLPMVEAHFGIPATGAVINTINTRLDPEAIAFQLQHSEAKLLFADREFSATVKRALAMMPPDLRPPVIDIADPALPDAASVGADEYETFIAAGDADHVWQLPADEWDAIALGYTSGTTGNPKGVVTHHRGAYLNALNNAFCGGMPPFAVFLWVVPMFHCNGWCHAWTMAALAGTNVCLRRVTPPAVFDAIRAHKVTNMGAAPIVYTALTDAPEQLRAGIDHRVTGLIAGAPPPSCTFIRAKEIGFDLIHVYGLTETYGPAAMCPEQPGWHEVPPEQYAHLVARQGFASLAQEDMRVLDPVTLEDVPADGATIGEIMFRGNIVMKGYLKNLHATREAFEGGWFHTGDLAVVEPDGFTRIRDRGKDVIISGGENISSVEVEDVICCHPGVSAAAVVARPDAKWGESPAAFVELREGHTLSEADLVAFCREHLAGFKIPKSITFGSLPRTSTGKVQKFVLRDTAKKLFGAVKFGE